MAETLVRQSAEHYQMTPLERAKLIYMSEVSERWILRSLEVTKEINPPGMCVKIGVSSRNIRTRIAFH